VTHTLTRFGAAIAVTLGVAIPASAQRIESMSGALQRAQTAPIVIEAESLAGRASATDGAVTVQNMSGFGVGWSNGAQLFWRAPDPGGGPLRNAPRLTLTINVPTAGDYLLAIRHTKAPDYGDVRVFVGGAGVGGFEGFSPRVQAARTEIGRVTLAQGPNALMLTISQRPRGSNGSFVGLDSIELALVRAPQRADDPPRVDRGTVVTDTGLANVKPVLGPGAKLYRFWHNNLDAPPTWADTGSMDLSFNNQSTATGVFKWDVSAVPNAKAIAYQVTTSSFGPYSFGEPLQQKSYIAFGYRAGASGQLSIELPLTPPKAIAPANKAGVMADYEVRILPVLSLANHTVVGAPSNVLVVRTFAKSSPGSTIKINVSKTDPTVDVVKFAWVPYKYTAHWPPGCTPVGEEKSDLEVFVSALSDVWNWAVTAYADAKSFVAKTIVSAVGVTGLDIPPELVMTALDGALMAAGVPPNIPNLDKLMSDGAGFLADEMLNQLQVPESVKNLAAKTGVPVDSLMEDLKGKLREEAKGAILSAAQKAKAAAQGGSGQSCKGLREYEYIKITVRNTGPAVQKNVKVEVGDSVGAFKGLGFTLPVIAPNEEVVVPRYLYSPEHLNLPNINTSQLVSENITASWTAWNQTYFHNAFTFKVRVLGQNCAAGNCTDFASDEYTTPSREWGKYNSKPFMWP
jgi:hypothetical protein